VKRTAYRFARDHGPTHLCGHDAAIVAQADGSDARVADALDAVVGELLADLGEADEPIAPDHRFEVDIFLVLAQVAHDAFGELTGEAERLRHPAEKCSSVEENPAQDQIEDDRLGKAELFERARNRREGERAFGRCHARDVGIQRSRVEPLVTGDPNDSSHQCYRARVGGRLPIRR
jgi:hypothetical protein